MATTKITARKRDRIVASLRSQRTDVHAGIRTLAEYHEIVDRTAQTLAEAGAEPPPVEITSWGR